MRTTQRWTLALIATLVFLALTGIAGAAWQVTSSGNGYSKALSMPTGNTPSVSVSGVDVTVTWPANTIGGAAVDGYTIKRYDASSTLQSIGSACTGSISATSCTESNVPA